MSRPSLYILDGVFGSIVHSVIDKAQNKVAGIVRNICDIAEYFLQTFVKKPLIGIFLYLDEVGHLHYLIDFRKAHACVSSEFYWFDIHHRAYHSPFAKLFQTPTAKIKGIDKLQPGGRLL